MRPLIVLAPLADFGACLAALGWGVAPGRAQMLGFAAAAVLNAASWARATQRPSAARAALAAAVTLMAFVLRSGIVSGLWSAWSWPPAVALACAVIATAALLGAGYSYCARGSSLHLGSGANWRAGALGLACVAWLLRLIYSGQIELLPEEPYYWNYAQHLDYGYLDHPPMVGWLIRAATALFGNTGFGVRFAAQCCGLIATLFTYRLTRNLFGEASAWVAVVLMQILPFFFLSGMLMTPDSPLTAAWAATLYYLERALIAGRARAWWGAGICLGLGMLSKYTIALLGVSTVLFMLADGRSRIWWRRVEPYGAALLALAIFSPVILWNAEHEWASFAFQTSRRLAERHRFALHRLIGSAVVLLTPTGLLAVTALARGRAPQSTGDDDRQRAWRLLQFSMGVPLAVFTAFSLFHEVKLDWTGAPWATAVPVLAFGIVHAEDPWATRFRKGVRSAWMPTLVILMLFYGAGFHYLALGIDGLGYGRHPELAPVGWRELGRQIHEIADESAREEGRPPLIVGMDRNAIASELAFYAKDQAASVRGVSSAHLFGQVGLMYERWFPPAQQRDRTLLLVALREEDLQSPELASAVQRLGPVRSGEILRDGRFVRPYYYRFAYGYRGSAP